MAEAKRTCPTCTLPFEARNGNQRYCTETCREVAKWKRTAKVPCSTCGRPTGYKLGSVEAATCNDCRRESIEHGTPTGYGKGCRCAECKRATAAAHRAYQASRRLAPTTTCSKCPRPHYAYGLCAMHIRRQRRQDGTHKPSPSDAWDTPRNLAKYKARKAILRGATGSVDQFTVTDLLERDGRACGICGDVIPESIYPDPLSPSIDHIKPVSLGGSHTLKNARATHLRCNVARGNRIDVNTSSNLG